MKTYKGKYKVKNPKKYRGDFTKVVYRSMWERHCFKWCDECSEVIEWSSEEVVVPYYFEVDKKYHRYFVDLKIKYKGGKVVLIEIKPDKQTRPPEYKGRRTKRYLTEGIEYIKNQNKWEAAIKYSKERGWEFQIWTEHTLESMGIKPKTLKPLKKLKRL
jgi:hypothetical protein